MKDFVFRAGADGPIEFVGDFDGLYRTEVDPWGQSGSEDSRAFYYAVQRPRLRGLIQRRVPNGIGLEVGCGLGYVTEYLSKRKGMRFDGIDISRVAIDRASEMFPELNFAVCDIGDPREKSPVQSYDIVVMNQMLWYVLGDIETALTNCLSFLKSDGFFVISQAFLPAGQRYGAEISDGFPGAMELVQRLKGSDLHLVDAYYSEHGQELADGLLCWRKR